jgi:4-methyl-5(b-hydroxyethyl)-thiazole monophosphate biosynthesis
LEAVTIIDLLRRAQIEVVTAGLQPGPVKASRGTVLVPDTSLDAVSDQDFDMIVLPGGMPGAENLKNDKRVKGLLQRLATGGKYAAAICAAPMVLAESGLLDGKKATSYPGFLDRMAVPGMIYRSEPVVMDGKIVTSRGPGTAMDFALALIGLLAGNETRNKVETALLRPGT